MTPNLVLAAPPGARAMCLDTRDLPASVIASTSEQVSRLPLDGSAWVPVSLQGANSLDDDALGHGHTVMGISKEDTVNASTGTPNLVQNLNIVGFCAPVALEPVAVAYHPLNFLTYVVAQDGLNPGCFGGAFGPNHVVTLPPAIGPIPPKVITNPADSGITGTAGALALVLPEFAFPSPYGAACAAPSNALKPQLDCNFSPTSPSPAFALELAKLPPAATVFLLFGVEPLSKLLPDGCTAVVKVALDPFAIGVAAANGKLVVPAALPAGIPAGLQVRLQAAFSDSGQVVLSNGLLLHIAP